MAVSEQPNNSTTSANTSFSKLWTLTIRRYCHEPILQCIQLVSRVSALHPKRTIAGISVFAVLLFVIGIHTNFYFDTDESSLWTPRNSNAEKHRNWINNVSGFPKEPRVFVFVFHKDGSITEPNIRDFEYIFSALDTLRSVNGYDEICETITDESECDITGVTAYWNHNATLFHERVQTQQDLVAQMGDMYYDGTPVVDEKILGYPVRDIHNGTLRSVRSYFGTVALPSDDDAVADFEADALDVMLKLREDWRSESDLRLEVLADRSFADEFERAVVNDIPLVPVVFIVMAAFTSLVFWKRNAVQSRSLLGAMAVVSVLLSIMASFGLMFAWGVPFTSMTQILPFVLFGVGIDDAFIITCSYIRLDPNLDPVEKVKETVNEIGISIFLTSLTSFTAFALGSISSVPAIYRLCHYAFPSIAFIFLFQMSFFIACLVLDERRVQAGNRDWLQCLWCVPKLTEHRGDSTIDTIMAWYADKLLRLGVKAAVVLVFAGLAGGLAFSASKLEQSFKFVDVLPTDSYSVKTYYAFTDYSERSPILPAVIFRDVDQSDPSIQKQMDRYIFDLVNNTVQIEEPPDLCWFYDFRKYLAYFNKSSSQSDFNSNVAEFLSNPVFSELYEDDVVLDDSGAVTTSRCFIRMDNIDTLFVKQQIDALEAQRAVSHAQPINKGHENRLRFFTYEDAYQIWEFYAATAIELRDSTLSSIGAVTAITLLFVPHWSAAAFGLPIMCMLYADLLGVLQLAGISLNPVTYIALVMSIGLLIDFVVHILLRFYESPGDRNEKATHTLKTMGSSILLGAITTFLGTLPLAFSTSEIFFTIFVGFLSLVCLGAAHGLVLLPVLLSLFGPTVQITPLGKQDENGSSPSVDEGPSDEPTPSHSIQEKGDVYASVDPADDDDCIESYC